MNRQSAAGARLSEESAKPARSTNSTRPGANDRVRKSRKPSRPGTDTRSKLLDAAEQVFSNKGFDGTSLRDIAEAADLHLALSSYHYGTKERLFDEVIRRRAIEMERMRLEGLAKIDLKAQPTSETVRLMIEAYVSPMIRARYGSSPQWQAHVRLMARVVNVKRWTPMIRKHYDRCARVFLDQWRELLPSADNNALLNAYSFMVVTTLYVCSYTNRFGRWKAKSKSRKAELKAATNDLIQFVHAGFMALVRPTPRS
jgi:AcrR family transcriptional regulator